MLSSLLSYSDEGPAFISPLAAYSTATVSQKWPRRVEEEGFWKEAFELVLEGWAGIRQGALGGGVRRRARLGKDVETWTILCWYGGQGAWAAEGSGGWLSFNSVCVGGEHPPLLLDSSALPVVVEPVSSRWGYLRIVFGLWSLSSCPIIRVTGKEVKKAFWVQSAEPWPDGSIK